MLFCVPDASWRRDVTVCCCVFQMCHKEVWMRVMRIIGPQATETHLLTTDRDRRTRQAVYGNCHRHDWVLTIGSSSAEGVCRDKPMTSGRNCQCIFFFSFLKCKECREEDQGERGRERSLFAGGLSPFPEKNMIFQPPKPKREQRGIEKLYTDVRAFH